MENKKVSTSQRRIQEALDLRNMKAADLAHLTGISKPSISCYLSGKYEPKQKALYEMGKALDVAEMWLAGYDIPMERPAEQKKNDDLVEIITRLRKDSDFYSTVSSMSKLNDKQYKSLKDLLSAFIQE